MNYFFALKIFLRAAELGSFSAVAQELKIETSTISRQISEIERDLQVSLFNRNTRGLRLTEAGEVLYSHGSGVLLQFTEIKELVSSFNKKPIGELRINIPYTFGHIYIIPYLNEFLNLHPNISIKIKFNNDYIDLIKERIDLSIYSGKLPDSSLHAKILIKQKYLAWASEGWIMQNKKVFSGEYPIPELLGLKDIYVKKSRNDKWLKTQTNGRIISDDYNVLLTACQNGKGVAILPDWFVTDEKQKKLNIYNILPQWEFSLYRNPPPIWLLYPKKRIASSKVRCFIDFITNKIKEKPPLYFS